MQTAKCGDPVEGGLTVLVDGVVRRQLAPDDATLTFGRARESDTHLHVGPSGGHDDYAVSRTAGSVSRRDGQWRLRNVSETRPFVVVVRGHRIPIRAAQQGRHSQWLIGPDGVVVELPSPTATYEIALRPVTPPGTSEEWILHESGGSTVSPPPEATPYQRLVLAAKFLGRRQPGVAVGDALAAERATRAVGTGRVVTPKAVENVVAGWREWLEGCGLRDVAGRSNVDRVGFYLLAFNVLTEADRLDQQLVDDDDPRA
jgi:hypothetical protein